MNNDSKSILTNPVKLGVGILMFALGFLLLTIKITIMTNGVVQDGGVEVILPPNLHWTKYALFTLLAVSGLYAMATAYTKKTE